MKDETRTGQNEYHFGSCGYSNWRDVFEAWASWFFWARGDENVDVRQIRQDIEYCADSQRAQDIRPVLEEAALTLSDAQLLDLAWYWSSDEADGDAGVDYRHVPQEPDKNFE